MSRMAVCLCLTPPGPFLLVGMIDKFYVMSSVSLRLQVESLKNHLARP